MIMVSGLDVADVAVAAGAAVAGAWVAGAGAWVAGATVAGGCVAGATVGVAPHAERIKLATTIMAATTNILWRFILTPLELIQ